MSARQRNQESETQRKRLRGMFEDRGTRGSTCGCASSAATSDAAILPRTSMPPSIFTAPNIPSCNRSSRAKTGAGATWTKSCWTRAHGLGCSASRRASAIRSPPERALTVKQTGGKRARCQNSGGLLGILAGPAAIRLGGYVRDAAHVDPDRGQGPPGAVPARQSLVGGPALRQCQGLDDVSDSLRQGRL